MPMRVVLLAAALCAALTGVAQAQGQAQSQAQGQSRPAAAARMPTPAGRAQTESTVVGVVGSVLGGTSLRIAADLANVLNGPGLRIVPIVGQGSVQNLEDLQGKPAFDPKVIVDVVGPQKLASDELIKHKEKSVRALVAAALAEAADPSTVEPLIKLLNDDDLSYTKLRLDGLPYSKQAQPAEIVPDRLVELGRGALRVRVVDAQDEFPSVLARE